MKTFLLLSVLLFAPATTDATDELPAAPVSTLSGLKGADLDLLGEVRRIGDNVAKLREQAFRRPPLAVRVPESMRGVAAEIRAYSVLPPARLEARGRAWEDLGLGNSGSAARTLLALGADLAGIGYDPSGNRLLVDTELLTVDDFEPEGSEDDPATVLLMTGVRPDEPLVAHLLTHVRQHERTGSDFLLATTDEMLAGMAWAEGEANLVAVRYLFQGLGLSEDILKHRVDPGGFLDGALLPPGLADLPAVERNLLEFVYLDGFDFAVAEFRAGGWNALDRAMTRRTSTRQILHPERSAPVNPFPGGPPAPPDGLRLADEDVLGEKAIVLLIAHGSGKDNLGMIAGDGWAGGRLYRWEAEDGRGITDWSTRWDSSEAAADFSYSFARALTVRFPGVPLRDLGEGRQRLDSDDRVFAIESSGTDVRVRAADPAWAGALPSPASTPTPVEQGSP